MGFWLDGLLANGQAGSVVGIRFRVGEVSISAGICWVFDFGGEKIRLLYLTIVGCYLMN